MQKLNSKKKREREKMKKKYEKDELGFSQFCSSVMG